MLRINKNSKIKYNYLKLVCYGPSVISVTVTKGGHPKGSRLYRISGIRGQGVAKLYKKIQYVRTWEYRNIRDVLTY